MPDNSEQTREAGRAPGAAERRPRRARRLSIAVLITAALVASLLLMLDSRASSASSDAPRAAAFEPVAAATNEGAPQDIDFSRFGHTNPQHARLPCLLCHQRTDNSPRIKRPGHTPCSGCHTQQFADSSSPVCTICHTNTQTGALKGFPGLRSFNVRFDHATHTRGGAAPRQSCANCHTPERRGVSLSIPAGTAAHSTCFRCHTPQAQSAGRDISSCGTCHRVGPFARTPETAAAYRVNFSHARHTSKGLSCADCHQVRAGQPQRRQVTAPVALMHHAPAGSRSCASCHDNKRAFGGDDFKDCTRCHEGNAWHF